ncbi:MAG: DUF2721 domain-containing protein [Anaerolineae bacterium]
MQPAHGYHRWQSAEVNMDAEMVAQIIQSILAPVLMVNACAILVGALFTRYVGINDRLRSMAHERLSLLRDQRGNSLTHGEIALLKERLNEIDVQMPDLLRRHQLAHHAVAAIYVSVCIFVVDMFVIALSVTTDTAWASPLALLIFLAGISLMLVSIFMTVLEVSTSRGVVIYEVKRIMHLSLEDMIKGEEQHGKL